MKKNLKALSLMLLYFISPLQAQKTIFIRSLKDAIDYSLANNESLLMERLTVHANGSRVKKDIGAYFPRITIAFSDSALVNFNASDYRNKNFNLGLSFLAYDGGERKLEYKLNILENYFDQLKVEEKIEEHCIEIMETYYDYQNAYMSKKNLERTKDNAIQYKLTLEKEIALGMILETDLMDYEIKLLELDANLSKQENRIENLLFLLKNLLGMEIQDQLKIQEDDLIVQMKTESFEDKELLLRKLLDSSNERKKMIAEYEYSEKIKKLEETFYKPRLSIEPSIGFEGDEFPMHGPKFQLMFSMSFDRNPFVSFQGSQSFTREKKSLTGTVSYSQASSKNNFAWKENKKVNKLNQRKQIINLKSYDEELKIDFHHRIMELNALKRTIDILNKEIQLNELKTVILRKEIEKGIKCPVDLIEHQIVLAGKMTSLYENSAKLKTLQMKLQFCINKKNGEFYESSPY